MKIGALANIFPIAKTSTAGNYQQSFGRVYLNTPINLADYRDCFTFCNITSDNLVDGAGVFNNYIAAAFNSNGSRTLNNLVFMSTTSAMNATWNNNRFNGKAMTCTLIYGYIINNRMDGDFTSNVFLNYVQNTVFDECNNFFSVVQMFDSSFKNCYTVGFSGIYEEYVGNGARFNQISNCNLISSADSIEFSFVSSSTLPSGWNTVVMFSSSMTFPRGAMSNCLVFGPYNKNWLNATFFGNLGAKLIARNENSNANNDTTMVTINSAGNGLIFTSLAATI
jgi:hypothetical protein